MSYFKSIRENHPVKCGDIIDGKKVVGTCWQTHLITIGDQEAQSEPVAAYRLEGEMEYRQQE